MTSRNMPISPTTSDSPLLRSAFANAAGEPSTDRQGDTELLEGLFGPDVEIGEVEETENLDVEEDILGEQDTPNGQMSESPEAREARVLPSPVRPSAEAIEKHKATHLPYRSWCPVCVKAKGRKTHTVGRRRARAKRIKAIGCRKFRWTIRS
jgi:hypothetical protein